MTKVKRLAILGSTGSIGTQALDIIRNNPDRFHVEVLTAHSNATLLIRQAKEMQPNAVVIVEESGYEEVNNALTGEGIKVYCGTKALSQVVEMEDIDIVLSALVGFAGVLPTINAIQAGKHIALANKEVLVVAGEIVTRTAREAGVNILPVDSEHSAIFQCITGEFHNPIEKVILTASGGPFRGRTKASLHQVSLKEALDHPNWQMGSKVTIDSATLMNKGLEVIEAKWLFGLSPNQVEVIIHPQSIIHSMVQFSDGSIKAQMGLPDMRLPIQYALAYPERISAAYPRFDFAQYPTLDFEKPDTDTFRNLALAYEAMRQGGNMPCILNAANEIAVESFCKGQIAFLQMAELVEEAMQKCHFIAGPSMEDYLQTNSEARHIAIEIAAELQSRRIKS